LDTSASLLLRPDVFLPAVPESQNYLLPIGYIPMAFLGHRRSKFADRFWLKFFFLIGAQTNVSKMEYAAGLRRGLFGGKMVDFRLLESSR
jgi:hypothetical protein